MSNDENKFQPIFQILHIKSAWFLLELAMALVTTIGMRFLQVCMDFWGGCSKRYDVKECVTHGVYWVNLKFKDRNSIDALRCIHIYV